MTRIIPLLLLLALSSLGAGSGRTGPVIEWLTELQRIGARFAANEDAGADLRSLHGEISRRLSGRPDSGFKLPEFPGGAPDRMALAQYASKLRAALEEAERNRPGGVFNAGRIEVNVTASAAQVPTAASLDESEYRLHNLPKMADALNLIPGVTIQRTGQRNERGVFVRGFDFRQVPLYMDGIPIYVPYDGYADLDRFLAYDVSEIQVAKGFTSPLYGPNAIGGAINMISKEPTRKLNLDLGAGYASGDRVHGFLNAGTRFDKFWLQGGFAWLSSDSFPLSGDFQPTPRQPDRHRRNAYQTDNKGRIRAAWTPNASDQYSFTYAKQTGEKGNPPYAGTDPAVRPRYWQWPKWDKESFYFIGNKSIGETGYVRARLYYDKFDNVIYAYDNANYNSQTRPSSFISPYDDDTYGTTTEFGSKLGRRQTVKGSFYFKDDTHREGNLGEAQRTFRDQTYSFGVQDTVELTGRTTAILGFSADRLDVRNAQNIVSGVVQPFPRNDVWSYNPQAGLFHALTDSSKIRFTYARKTRLPTIKDRYSYRMGQAVPNPDLREERSDNFEAGYSQLVGLRSFLEVSLFQSNVSGSTQRFYVSPNVYQLRNLGDARYLGGEMGFRTSLTRRLQFSTNYTYLSRRNQTTPSVIMLDTPRHKIYAAATHMWGDRVTLVGDLLYEGGRWNANDAGRVQRASSFASAGLSASVRLHRQIEMQTGIQNLFDRNYFLVEGYPEEGRSYYMNLRYRF